MQQQAPPIINLTVVLGHRQHNHSFQSEHRRRDPVVNHPGPFGSCRGISGPHEPVDAVHGPGGLFVGNEMTGRWCGLDDHVVGVFAGQIGKGLGQSVVFAVEVQGGDA